MHAAFHYIGNRGNKSAPGLENGLEKN